MIQPRMPIKTLLKLKINLNWRVSSLYFVKLGFVSSFELFSHTWSLLTHIKLSFHCSLVSSVRIVFPAQMWQTAPNKLTGKKLKSIFLLAYCSTQTHIGFWSKNRVKKRTACSSPNAPSPPTQKMTGTFQSCEREKLGDWLAWDSGTRSGRAIRILFTWRGSRYFPPRPTSHLLRTHSWVSELTAAPPDLTQRQQEACQRMFRKWLPLFMRDIPPCWSTVGTTNWKGINNTWSLPMPRTIFFMVITGFSVFLFVSVTFQLLTPI